MTARKMGRVKERVGGEERKETSIPLPALSFFGSRFIFRAAKIPRPPSLCSENTRKRLLRRLMYHTFCFNS